MLVEYFVHRYATRAGKNIRSIDKKTLDLLQAYDWPGNIRELQNVIERSVILSSSEVFAVDESWLPTRSVRPRPRVAAVAPAQGEPRSEREIIEAALAECRGRVAGSVRGGGEARRSTIHARPSHQGVEHQQSAIQVSLNPPDHQIHQIHQILQIHRIRQFAIDWIVQFCCIFSELRVASGLP